MRSIFTSQRLVRSQVRQDHIRAHSKPTKPKMPKFNKKTAMGRAPSDLFHPIKPCLGLAIGRYIGESNHQAADCRPSEASLQLPWQAKQGLLSSCKQDMNGYDGYSGKIIHLMDFQHERIWNP